MNQKVLLTSTTVIFFLILVLLVFFGKNDIVPWLNSQFLEIFSAVIMAIIAGMAVEYVYHKYSGKSRSLQTTMIMKPKKLLAKLIMPGGEEITITDYERIMGREDFIGLLTGDQLFFVGKKHFKLTKLDDGFYIEDMNTKNGTKINGEEIKGIGKVKLTEGDAILIANAFTVIYN
jgi:hypothetical protein